MSVTTRYKAANEKVNAEMQQSNSAVTPEVDKFDLILKRINEININMMDLKKCVEDINGKINSLSSDLTTVKIACEENSNSIKAINFKLDELEQYGRRNNLCFFGLPEQRNENTDNLIVSLIEEKMKINIKLSDIERSHRVGRKSDDTKKSRPIIVRFCSYRIRADVYNKKKALKGTNTYVHEDLSKLRRGLLGKAVAKYGIKKVWTADGRLYWLDTSDGHERRRTENISVLYNMLNN